MAAPSNEVLSWTSQDPRESQLFNAWGVVYRFATVVAPSGQSTTTLWRAVRANKEDRVAKLEWASNGGLGRAVIGKNIVPMSDLVRPDPRYPGARIFNAPDGLTYRWRQNQGSADVVLEDSAGNVVAVFRPTRPTRYQIGDVYGELHFLRNAGAATIMHPPIMDTVTVTAMLYRFCQAFGL
ncbi:hypothetical protein K503DRAFT_262649 [Rhizopogon vinicolor AM-OR11-026]|uniref:DUF6593 domain-containing protein n=2 Tax=Rhizopogon TaxID=5375 RepID=A0A1J8QJS8_9AGAM|nr:hypothetical protein K503DRAFT_262649 [Rhizopogon vinicolor AM-OR11-026]OJA20903.1 hypothetical protein AZE42_00874 [Rhizopogon vesiculosus]